VFWSWLSLPPAIIFGLMCHFGTPTVVLSIVMVILALAGSVVCVKFAPASIAATGKIDPREVVADEFAGQAVTFIPIGVAATGQIWATAVLGFLIFRLFDIVKPWPTYKFEKLPQGWGVLADDLMAGVYAGIALFICLRLGLVGYLSGLMCSLSS